MTTKAFVIVASAFVVMACSSSDDSAPPVPPKTAGYDHSCSAASDCQPVAEHVTCTDCPTLNAVIARKEVDRYNQELFAACGDRGATVDGCATGSPSRLDVACENGTCVVAR